MSYLLWSDIEGLKDNIKELESAIAILKQVGFPEGFVVNMLHKELTTLSQSLKEEEKYL